jgi:hypothetical protein
MLIEVGADTARPRRKLTARVILTGVNIDD